MDLHSSTTPPAGSPMAVPSPFICQSLTPLFLIY
ncbi:hypothetical protein LINPERPRIM_LOCUS23317 [Linum perenne]